MILAGWMRVSGRLLRAVLTVMVLMAGLVGASPALAAHTSTNCAPKSATVTRGGSVTIDITDCDYWGIGMGIGSADTNPAPAHGTAVNSQVYTGGITRSYVTYTHNGDSATSDYFQFWDQGNNDPQYQGLVAVSITIQPATSPVTVAPASLPTLTAGTSFSQTLSASGGTGPYTFALQSGFLPTGLSLNAGVISGTPVDRGTFNFTIRATDTANNQYTDKAYAVSVQAGSLSLSPTSATAFQGSPFSRTLVGAGGVPTYSFMYENGSIPSGISIASNGVVSGTTNAATGVYTMTVRVTDSSGGPGQYFELETFTLTVAPPNQAPTANAGPDQTVASAASVTLNGSGSSDPESQPLTYTWTQTAGPAVTLSSTSAAQPTFTAPTVAWNASPVTLTFSLRVNDGAQNSATADTVSITVNPAPNQLPTANAGPDQTVASAASVTLNGTGSSDPESQPLTYTWTQTAGPAVTLSSTSAAQPTFTAPTVAWNASAVTLTFSLRVNDGVQNSATADTVSITVNPAPNQAPTANAGPDQTVASAASVTLNGSGSSDPESQPLTYTWTQTAGPAVTLSSTSAAQPTFTAPTVAWNASAVTLTFSLRVNDGVQNSATADTVSITVNPAANQAPTANAGPDQTVASAASVTLNGSGSSDPENQTLTYSWTQTAGPAVTLSSTTAAQPTFTAPAVAWNASAVTLTFSLTVNDGVQNSATADTVSITVNPVPNQLPVANAGPDQTVASAAAVTLDGSGSTDPENQTLSYSWTQTAGPAVTLSSATAAQPTFTAPAVAWNASAVTLTFSLTVNDGVQNSATADTVSITVSPAGNVAPTANAGPDQTVASAASVTLNGTGSTDPENQTLTYSWTQTAGPAVTLSSATAAQPTFTAPTVAWNASAVTLTFSLTVNDGVQNSAAADTVSITVSPAANQTPTANAGPDQTVASAASVTLNGTGSSDPENQTLTYSWTQTAGPAVTLSSASAAQPTFTAPTVAWNASAVTLTFSLTVNDGVQNSAAADTVSITVNPAANLAPTANAGPDQTVASAAAVTLNGTGSTDPENQTLTYSWTQTAGPAVALSSASAAQPTFTAPAVAWNAPPATLTFSLRVNDGVQNSASADTVTITVSPAGNTAPTANAGPDQTVASAAAVTLNGTGSTDPENQPLTYSWTQTAGPAVTLSSAAAAQPTFTAPTVAWNAAPVTLTFSLRVNDGVQNSASADTVSITVNPAANQAPTANAGIDQSVASAASVTLNGSGSTDPEHQPLTYSWTQTAGPAVTLSSTAAAQPTFTAPAVAAGSPPVVLRFSLTVNDGVQNSATADSVQINVSPAGNTAPTANAGPDQTVASAAAVTLNGTGSTDPEGQPLSYSWTQTAGPAVTLSGAATAQPTFTAPAVATGSPPVVLTFDLMVNDGVQNSAVADQVSVTVQPVTLALSPASGTALAAGTVGTVYAERSISASGGIGTISYAVSGGALPGGLSLNAASGAITGTPTASGAFTFTVTASDSGGSSVSASYSIRIAATSVHFVFTPAGGALPDAMVGTDYRQAITVTGGTAPLTFSLASGTLPKGLVLNISTGELTGPLASDAVAGPYAFRLRVTDRNGATGTADFTLQVKPLKTSVSDIVIDVPAGSSPPNVYLNRGATGGPFTGAEVVSMTPPDAGTASIIRGELAQASAMAVPVGWYLKFVPKPDFIGTVQVRYRLIGVTGPSNIGTVTFRITHDPDKVAEEIDGLVRDFVKTRQNLISSAIKVPGLADRRRLDQETDPVTARMMPNGDGISASLSTSLNQIEAARDRADGMEGGEPSPFNVWIDTTFLLHTREDIENRWGSFAMVNLGADYLVNDRFLLGLSLHVDRMTDPVDSDAELTGNGWMAGPYASVELARNIFWNASLRYGGSSNDIDTPFWDGSFETTRWMADTSLEGEWMFENGMTFSPKLRMVYFSENVDDYTVRNAAGNEVSVEGFDEDQFRVSLGAEIARSFTLEDGSRLTPKLGLTGGYAGLDGSGAFGMVTAGVSMETVDDWTLEAGTLFTVAEEGEISVGGKLRAAKRF